MKARQKVHITFDAQEIFGHKYFFRNQEVIIHKNQQ